MSESMASCPMPLLDKHRIVRLAGAGAQFYVGENNPHMSADSSPTGLNRMEEQNALLAGLRAGLASSPHGLWASKFAWCSLTLPATVLPCAVLLAPHGGLVGPGTKLIHSCPMALPAPHLAAFACASGWQGSRAGTAAGQAGAHVAASGGLHVQWGIIRPAGILLLKP